MSYRSLLIAFLAAALLTGACSDNDGGTATPNSTSNNSSIDAGEDVGDEDTGTPPVDMGEPGPGELVIEPSLLTFSDVRMGETATQQIDLRNLGESNIVVTQARISELDRQGESEFRAGERIIDGTTIIEPNTFISIDIVYAPNDTEVDRGIVEIFSDDPDSPMVTIRLETISAYPDARAPRFVRFGQVNPGETASQRVIVYNRGIDSLLIDDVTIVDGPARFSIEFIPTDTPPVSLARNQDLQFDLVYSPNNDQLHVGRMQITSNDPDQPMLDIGLTGNNASPCIVTDPRFVDFGEIESGTTATQEVTVFNCGAILGAEVDGVQVVDDAAGALSIANLPNLPLTIAPLQTSTFDVSMSFVEPGLRIGSVELTSDSDSSPYLLEVRATVPEEQ